MTYHYKFSSSKIVIVLLLVSNVCLGAEFSLCKRSVSAGDDAALVDDGSVSQDEHIVSCPRPSDPVDFTTCCYDKHFENESVAEGFEKVSFTTFRCCAKPLQPSLFSFVSDHVAIIFGICVTALLLLTTMITLVCCFWWRCPLYMLCRIKYRQDDIIAYDSIDDETRRLNGMPSEQKKGIKIYCPNVVKVTLRDDD